MDLAVQITLKPQTLFRSWTALCFQVEEMLCAISTSSAGLQQGLTECFCASSVRCRLCICTGMFMLAVIPSSFQFRQCFGQSSCIKFLPHVPCLGFLVGNHKIKGQAMGYQPWLDVGWFVALENLAWGVKLIVQGHFHWQWVQQMILWMRLGRLWHLWNLPGDPNISGPDSDFPNDVSQNYPLQNNCTSDKIDTYMTQEIRVMSDLPEETDFFIAVCGFFWPPLFRHI